MLSLLRIVGFALAIGQFCAVAVASAASHDARSVVARQIPWLVSSGEVPDDCQATCGPIINNTCGDYACMCTEDINKAFMACINCIEVSGNDGRPATPEDASLFQPTLATYEDSCKQLGHPLSSLTISGFDGSTSTFPSLPGPTQTTSVPASVTSTSPGSQSTTTSPGSQATTSSGGGGSAAGGGSGSASAAGTIRAGGGWEMVVVTVMLGFGMVWSMV